VVVLLAAAAAAADAMQPFQLTGLEQ